MSIKQRYFKNIKLKFSSIAWLNYFNKVLNSSKDPILVPYAVNELIAILYNWTKALTISDYRKLKALGFINPSQKELDSLSWVNPSLKNMHQTKIGLQYAYYVIPKNDIEPNEISTTSRLQEGYGNGSKKDFVRFMLKTNYYKYINIFSFGQILRTLDTVFTYPRRSKVYIKANRQIMKIMDRSTSEWGRSYDRDMENIKSIKRSYKKLYRAKHPISLHKQCIQNIKHKLYDLNWFKYFKRVYNNTDWILSSDKTSLLYYIVTKNFKRLREHSSYLLNLKLHVIPKRLNHYDYKYHKLTASKLTKFISDYAHYVITSDILSCKYKRAYLQSGYGRASKKQFITFLIMTGYYKKVHWSKQKEQLIDHSFILSMWTKQRLRNEIKHWPLTMKIYESLI